MLARPRRGTTVLQSGKLDSRFATVILWLDSLRSDMMETVGKTGSGELEGEAGEGLEVTDDSRTCLLPRNWVRAVLGLPNHGDNKGAMRYAGRTGTGQGS